MSCCSLCRPSQRPQGCPQVGLLKVNGVSVLENKQAVRTTDSDGGSVLGISRYESCWSPPRFHQRGRLPGICGTKRAAYNSQARFPAISLWLAVMRTVDAC